MNFIEEQLREFLIEKCERSSINESKKEILKEYIEREITYEQMLNLVFNPLRKEMYLPKEFFEQIIKEDGDVLIEGMGLVVKGALWMAKLIGSMAAFQAGTNILHKYVTCKNDSDCFKIKQGEDIIAKLQQNKHLCNQSDNPALCMKAIDKQIRAITQQIVEIKTKQREKGKSIGLTVTEPLNPASNNPLAISNLF